MDERGNDGGRKEGIDDGVFESEDVLREKAERDAVKREEKVRKEQNDLANEIEDEQHWSE